MPDELVPTKREVKVRSVARDQDGNFLTLISRDYYHEEHLAAALVYLRSIFDDPADPVSNVSVSEGYFTGPGGYHGAYCLPSDIIHPDAGVVREAEEVPEGERLVAVPDDHPDVEAYRNPQPAAKSGK